MIIEVLGVPIDLGADRRGVDMGPSAIRYGNLVGQLEAFGHQVTDLDNLPLMLGDRLTAPDTKAKYLTEIVAMARTVMERVSDSCRRGAVPLVLGGDHSVSLGSVAGAAVGRSVGLIWVDAHGDFNTPETSPSGNVHGMILAALAGYGDPAMTHLTGEPPIVQPSRMVLVGVRELDPGERALLGEAGVRVLTMTDIDQRGMATIMLEALEAVREADLIHLSLDLDVVDPVRAPGVGTPVPGGISYREGQLAMEMIAATGRLASLDVVEVNPILDDHNQTAGLAVDFILSALGKRIL